MNEGFVKRELVRSDSRKFHIKIEPNGEKKAAQIIKIFDSLESKIEAHLGMLRSSNLQRDLLKLSLVLGPK